MIPRKIVPLGASFLHALLSKLTAVMLFAHTVLGCCSHHVHACGESHGSVAFGVGTSHCSDACGEHSAGNSRQTGHEHQGSGHDDCRGTTCDFGRPTNGREANACYVLARSMDLRSSDPLSALAGGQVEHELGVTRVLLPIRLHLVHQVLLI